MVEPRSSKKTTQLGNKEDQNPIKFYSRFLFKALILAVLCSIVPVFLSQTPELANKTRLLELLHLVFVGIAVSYGLFSSRNYDGGGGSSNNDHKSDDKHTNPQAYLPKILEVSSVFNVDHEGESEPSDDSSGDHRQIQTWRNKYRMKSPEVILSKDHETRFVDRVSSEIREKPLLLPVRSLNYSRVSDSGDNSGGWEKVRSKRQLIMSLVDDNSDVLPSPIPWRSRSSSSSTTESESQPSIKNLDTVNPQPLIKTQANLTSSSSFSSSPRKSTPLPKLTSESGAKSAEDSVRKQEFRPSPSPPPPPPPLPAFYNSASRKDNPPGIYRIESRESVQKKKFAGGEFHPPPPPPPPPPMDYYKSPPTKFRVSSERRKPSEKKMKLDDRSVKRNSPKKVWWSDPVAESKEHRDIREDTEKNDRRSFLVSKATEESEDKEHKRTENEINEDDEHSEIEEKKIIEEGGVCGNNSDVDKKADEFIAKFREQIRLQRIESIKRSANKISANPSR